MYYFDKTMHEWIILVHSNINKINNWKYKIPKINSYGYNNFISVLTKLFLYIINNQDDIFIFISGKLDFNKYIDILHNGWRDNYIYYVNNKKLEITEYRNLLAITNSDKLSACEKEKYNNIILSVFDILTNSLINKGIESLSIR